jgi:hypothetical protein
MNSGGKVKPVSVEVANTLYLRLHIGSIDSGMLHDIHTSGMLHDILRYTATHCKTLRMSVERHFNFQVKQSTFEANTASSKNSTLFLME